LDKSSQSEDRNSKDTHSKKNSKSLLQKITFMRLNFLLRACLSRLLGFLLWFAKIPWLSLIVFQEFIVFWDHLLRIHSLFVVGIF
jgi:hypothetical protein